MFSGVGPLLCQFMQSPTKSQALSRTPYDLTGKPSVPTQGSKYHILAQNLYYKGLGFRVKIKYYDQNLKYLMVELF